MRFEKELQTLAILKHPNIAQVYDFAARGRESPYFTMEYVEGRSLTEYCDAEGLPIRDRLALFLQVCDAVQYVHQNGILHRDLKPSNVVVTENDGKPLAKLIDFGLAKLSRELWESSRTLTKEGQAVGTLCYMSPEQAGLTEETLDIRTDVYALGVMLYELLTGVLPFDQPRNRAEYAEFLRKTRDEDPPRPSERVAELGAQAADVLRVRGSDHASLLRQLRGDLDWIVHKALEKPLLRRYATVLELRRDIVAYLSGEPVRAHRPTSAYRFARAVHRHRRGLLVTMTLFATLVISATLGTVGYLRLDDEHQRRVQLLRLSERVQVRAANAHLWFEELLAGDAAVDLHRDVLHPLQEAAAELDAALGNAGAEAGGADPAELRGLQREVLALHTATEERWEQRGATGGESDQLYDELYKSILHRSQGLLLGTDDRFAAMRTTLASLVVIANGAVLASYLAVSVVVFGFWGRRARHEEVTWT